MLLADRYRVVRTLGLGGMASVYLAEDERLGRQVAVKRLHADRVEDLASRFEREARLGASLNHPNIVAIYDTVADPSGLLLVMEYVDGLPLSAMLGQGPLEPSRTLEILRGMAAALDHAHEQGVVHRDVKPANVLVRPDGVVKLADLGIATAAEATLITTSGTVLGTPAYMAPERLEGRESGAAADVYALAAVAFELLSGRKAQTGATPLEIAGRVASQPPPDLREAWPDAPPRAAEILKHAMARDPAERPPSAEELVAELEQAISEASARTVRSGATATQTMPARGDRNRSTSPRSAAGRAEPRPTPAAERPPPAYFRTAEPSRSRQRGRWLAGAALLLAVGAAALALTTAGGEESGGRVGPDRQGGGTARPAERPSAGAQTARDSRSSPPGDGSGSPTSPPPPPAPIAPVNAAEGARLNDLGYRLSQQGRHQEAVPVLARAVASFPEGSSDLPYAFALYNYGRALRMTGRADEAIPVLERRLRFPNQRATVRRELEAARQEASASP